MGVGSKTGLEISAWKAKNRPSTKFARILSKIGGLCGGAIEVIAAIGLIASGVTKSGSNTWQMVGLFVVGLAIDVGSHWIALKIDKKLSAK